MKVLLVDNKMVGHHLFYANSILTLKHEFIFLSSERCEKLDCSQIIHPEIDFHPRKISSWLKFIKMVKKVAEEQKVDCVHFLDGAIFYRFFGFGLSKLKTFKTIVTFHVIRFNFIRNISLKNIFKHITFGTTHTDLIKKEATKIGIKNIVHIEYPDFTKNIVPQQEYFINLPKNVPIIAAIGSTRYDKGLDILLEALKNVKHDFHLLIAGVEKAFDRTFIAQHSTTFADKVTTYFEYLSDDTLVECYNKATIIAVPYRKTFNGASGPLTEAASRGKCIIGPNHGSLADIITTNHLGYTFESENVTSLTEVIDTALETKFEYDETAKKYQDFVNPRRFQEDYKKLYRKI